MTFQRTNWQHPLDYLEQRQPDRPVIFFHADTLAQTAKQFLNGFDGLVTYAVKANPDQMVLSHLVNAGVTSFDVASPSEMKMVRSHGADLTMHYNNPVRSVAEIQIALNHGIRSFSVDRYGELAKLIKLAPKGCEISVRLKLPTKGAAYDFGDKFGATPDECKSLLQQARDAGFQTSMTFHPGTQCEDAQTWVKYISTCANIARSADVKLQRLNVGGGFPSFRGAIKPELNPIFECIAQSCKDSFGDESPKLVCEPGRAMVAEAFTLVTRVKARDRDVLFLNDGVYGGLTEFRDIGNCERYSLFTSKGSVRDGTYRDFTIFGPTCDSIDRLPECLSLPETVSEGDYILFKGMGAYVQSIATQFNGYGAMESVVLA
ncbi:ornithine decarboxylase [Amylibacter kogurei]|uniref:ornithine decarboxylase n=1 Tax=Paramylibacter kogurei TaxID=1889778 RepID=A0A2G5K3B9_9RHOB|nr:type III PLP-dependent enzyme [Amylibacter kogurei]PIB23503.1 ornithine decarboxylase [Amylibacter kogurei]